MAEQHEMNKALLFLIIRKKDLTNVENRAYEAECHLLLQFGYRLGKCVTQLTDIICLHQFN